MPNREFASDIAVLDSIGAGNKSGTLDGSTVDVRDANAATVVISFGANVDAGATCEIQHGNESDGSDAVALTPAQVAAVGVELYGQDYAAPVANQARRFAYVGGMRYVRVVLGGTVADTDLHAQVILDRLHVLPNLSGFTEA